jgi:hypothetical protein
MSVVVTSLNAGSALLALVAAYFWYRASHFPKDITIDLGDIGGPAFEPPADDFFEIQRKSAQSNSRGALAASGAAVLQGLAIAIGLI